MVPRYSLEARVGIAATSVGSDLPLGIFAGKYFSIGQLFPWHSNSYYQSTVGVAMHCLSSSFTSEPKTASRGKSEISDRSRISACTKLKPLPLFTPKITRTVVSRLEK